MTISTQIFLGISLSDEIINGTNADTSISLLKIKLKFH